MKSKEKKKKLSKTDQRIKEIEDIYAYRKKCYDMEYLMKDSEMSEYVKLHKRKMKDRAYRTVYYNTHA